MDINTVFIYENERGSIRFAYNSPFWVTELSGASAVQVDLHETQGAAQVGTAVAGHSVQARSLTLDGCLRGDLAYNRRKLLSVIAPGVASRLAVISGGEEYCLEVTPTRTPEVAPGEGIQTFQTQLRAAYPYWKSAREQVVQLAGLEPRFRFPFFSGSAFNLSVFSESYYRNVPNRGNVPMEFELTFAARARLTDPEVIHMATRRHIRLNRTMQPGEAALVSTVSGQKRVIIRHADGSTENGFRYLSVESDLAMALAPGDNLLRSGARDNREALNTVLRAPEGVRSGV